MRVLQLTKRNDPKADFSYVDVNETHYDELLDEDCKVLDPDGNIVFVLLKKRLSKESVTRAWNALKDWEPLTSSRGLAQGHKQEFKYVDGKKTNLKKGREYCVSGVFGFYDRFPTIPACRPCAWNAGNPELYKETLALTAEVARLHKEYDPRSFAVYEEIAARTHKDFMMPGSPYTTVTMNKNFRTFPHKDGFNLHATCPMTVIRKGKFTGGNLVFMEHRIAVKIDTFDLILFMNSTEWHGNTRIVDLSGGSVRGSIIWYYRKGMVECGSMQEELDRVKNAGLAGF